MISFDPDTMDSNNPIVAPQSPAEVEAEWKRLPGDSWLPEPDIHIHDMDQSIIRRYEFYEYTGTYNEVHLPSYQSSGGPLPADAPLGQFIVASMVAVNLVPEPSSLIALLFCSGTLALGAVRCKK
ncbi:MAG: PEP-CTERM sorting domain-containing protein [Armatimonadota bacterium]